MRIGLCTTDFKDAMPAAQLFAKMKAMGYETTQLAFRSVSECNFTEDNQIEIPESVSEEAIAAILAASNETGVDISAVNGTWNMAHPDKAVREEGLRRFPGFCKAVRAVGAPIVSLCSGSRSLEGLWRYHPETQSDEAWADMAESMKRAAKIAEEYGLILAIETEANNTIDTPEKARRIMDETGSPALKMILDCANLFHPGTASPETMRPTIDCAMREFGKDVVIAHGKDIRPSEGIDFCGTGFGIVDFPYMVQKLTEAGFSGVMALHGIYKEDDMPICLEFMKNAIAQARKEHE
ncbi:MAG: sugar phosphate isomerase/epimerase [Clostridia bacterium]|nr:sugar phosphate isomerase/epimerase [Clostridia bacterium]MBQ4085277.1 sugar phosphate isomerase/epimerase [Clostridia bacterium]